MKYNLLLTEEAQAEISDAVFWYEQQQTGLGKEFLSCINEAFCSLEINPNLTPIVFENLRKLKITRFPYNIFYLTENESIIVFAIFHHRRNPESWKKRNQTLIV